MTETLKERDGVSGDLRIRLNEKNKEYIDLERTLNQTVRQKDNELLQSQKKLDESNSRLEKVTKDFKSLS